MLASWADLRNSVTVTMAAAKARETEEAETRAAEERARAEERERRRADRDQPRPTLLARTAHRAGVAGSPRRHEAYDRPHVLPVPDRLGVPAHR